MRHIIKLKIISIHILILLSTSLYTVNINAKQQFSAILMEPKTNKILYQYNAKKKSFPASLTKMMIIYLTFKAINENKITWETILPISQKAMKQEPSKLEINRTDIITIKEAILSLIVKSANDVAFALGEQIAKIYHNKLSKLMNSQAKKLKMFHTNFINPSGLHNKKHFSTSRDMMKLAVSLKRDFSENFNMFATATFQYKNKTYKTTNNTLISYPGATGIKTGYTKAAGFNLASSIITEDNQELFLIIFGAKDAKIRNEIAALLFDYGKEILKSHQQLQPKYKNLHGKIILINSIQ
ncbi:MAG: D-alanyl-D-alanine carboxypeptidase [Anaplasmataceae bacterium]|nr:D-alanyl-D-alanine carboxypeptidase [Anaplasmataceae bacterium]